MAVSGSHRSRVGLFLFILPFRKPGDFSGKEAAIGVQLATFLDITLQPPRMDDAEIEAFFYKNFDVIKFLLTDGFTGSFELSSGLVVTVVQGIITNVE